MGTHYCSEETKRLEKQLKYDGEIKCYIELCQGHRDDFCNKHLSEEEKKKLDKYGDKFYAHYPESREYYTKKLLHNPPWSFGWNYSDRENKELNLEDDSFSWHNRTYSNGKDSEGDKSWLTCKGIHVYLPNNNRVLRCKINESLGIGNGLGKIL